MINGTCIFNSYSWEVCSTVGGRSRESFAGVIMPYQQSWGLLAYFVVRRHTNVALNRPLLIVCDESENQQEQVFRTMATTEYDQA